MEPAFTYRHRYHQAMVYKIFMAVKTLPEPITTVEGALSIIRQMHEITCGLPQIVYLVGWQYDGHDSQYPAFFEANRHLKRPADADARESLIWLMREARAYNAVVSLHLNLIDAYENSPLWEEYFRRDLIIKNADGTLMKGCCWGGEQSYFITQTREWECGLGQQRIDRLLEYLPIAEAGTVHIDAFYPQPYARDGVDLAHAIETVKQICRYWDAKGIDVTTEHLDHHELVGYFPAVWVLNLDEQSRLRYPPALLCGGGDGWNQRHLISHQLPSWIGFFCAPEAGTKYEEAWGRSCSCDVVGRRTTETATFPLAAEMLQPFCEKALPWLFLNRHRALALHQTAETYDVTFSDGVVSSVQVADRRHRITQDRRVLVEDGEVFLPAFWCDGAIIAWSRNGGRRHWELPPEWHAVAKVRISRLDAAGKVGLGETAVAQGILDLAMAPLTALLIEQV